MTKRVAIFHEPNLAYEENDNEPSAFDYVEYDERLIEVARAIGEKEKFAGPLIEKAWLYEEIRHLRSVRYALEKKNTVLVQENYQLQGALEDRWHSAYTDPPKKEGNYLVYGNFISLHTHIWIMKYKDGEFFYSVYYTPTNIIETLADRGSVEKWAFLLPSSV